MVDVGFNTASLIGLFDLLLAVGYAILSIVLPLSKSNFLGDLGLIIYIGQGVIATVILLLCGIILLFEGWRLDPMLQFAVFLQTILILCLGLKDIFILNLVAKKFNSRKGQ